VAKNAVGPWLFAIGEDLRYSITKEQTVTLHRRDGFLPDVVWREATARARQRAGPNGLTA
jgi:hypothetical protein